MMPAAGVRWDARRVRADPAPEWQRHAGMPRFAAPLASYAIMVVVGWQAWTGDTGAVGWLVATILLLLIGNLPANDQTP